MGLPKFNKDSVPEPVEDEVEELDPRDIEDLCPDVSHD